MDFDQIMRRYKIDSMKYDQRVNGEASSGLNMNDWNQYSASPPSSRNGEDDASSVTHSRPPRRSRLDKDIPHTRGPMIIQPAPSSSRKSNKHGSGNVNMNNGGSRGHNSTFNGYDIYKRYQHNSSRGPNESFSGIYPNSRNASGYASDYGRMSVGLMNTSGEPRRPRSTAAEKYVHNVPRNGFGGYESGESENNSEEIIDEEEENEEVARTLYMEARRAQGSRSVTNYFPVENYGGEDEKYYFGVVKLGSQMVDHVLRTMPPPEEYLRFKPLERVAYIFYCAVYKKPYQKIQEFRNIFNREYFNYVCSGDTEETALYKICKSMQDQYTLKQLEASRLAYEKAQKEAAESEKLDFNQHRLVDPDEKVVISQPEEVLSNGPLHYHSCLQFATIGVGGKVVMIRPAGTVDAVSGNVLSTTSVHVDDLRTLLHFDEQSGKVIESVQNFKGPLIAGQTPTHSVRLYIQRQIDSLRQMRNSADVKKSEVVDALLIWQLLEIMVQQHGRVTGPDIAALLTVASEELSERTGISEGVTDSVHKSGAKERFNKFLLGGHINEAVESAISDGLYADAMTLIRRLNPNDAKKIEEIETRFMNLRSIDDPFATLVSVANNQLPPMLTNSAFDDDNNWKRHAAIVLANLTSDTAINTIYRLGLLLARKNRNCAADFCLLVVCVLTGYDTFSLPKLIQSDGQERSREHIGLVHSGSNLLNRVDGLSGIAGFSFTDLHATDIFDYALRLGNNNTSSPLAKSIEYQMARIEYAKKLASYGGFATDAFRYCTEVARSLWMHINAFDKNSLLNLCDLADSLWYVAATTEEERRWIETMREMLNGEFPSMQENQSEVAQQEQPHMEEQSFVSEAQTWHDEHQAPLEITKKMIPHYHEESVHPPKSQDHHHNQVQHAPQHEFKQPSTHPSLLPPKTVTKSESSYESTVSTVTGTSVSSETIGGSTSQTSTIPEPTPAPPLPKIIEQPMTPPAVMPTYAPPTNIPTDVQPPVSVPQQPLPPMNPPPMTPPPPSSVTQPISIASTVDPDIAKSPRRELEDLWSAAPAIPQPAFHAPPAMSVPPPSMTSHQPPASAPSLMQPTHGQPSVPNTKTAAPPTPNKPVESKNDQKTSGGWFGSIRDKMRKSMPSSNQMILPDDKKPSIVWDNEKKAWVGEGVAQEVVAPPPPAMSAPHLMSGGADSNKSSTSSLRNARSGLGSRYLQSGMQTSQTPSMNTGMPSMMPPTMMPLPTSFSFVPAATDDNSSEYVDPFSSGATSDPSEPGSQPNDQ